MRAEHQDHDGRSRGNEPPRLLEAIGHGQRVVAGALPFLVNAGQHQNLVVHREAEHNAEQHHRRGWVDRFRCEIHELVEPHSAFLEDEDQHAKGGGHAQDVHHHSLQWDDDRADLHKEDQARGHEDVGHRNRQVLSDGIHHVKVVRSKSANQRNRTVERVPSALVAELAKIANGFEGFRAVPILHQGQLDEGGRVVGADESGTQGFTLTCLFWAEEFCGRIPELHHLVCAHVGFKEPWSEHVFDVVAVEQTRAQGVNVTEMLFVEGVAFGFVVQEERFVGGPSPDDLHLLKSVARHVVRWQGADAGDAPLRVEEGRTGTEQKDEDGHEYGDRFGHHRVGDPCPKPVLRDGLVHAKGNAEAVDVVPEHGQECGEHDDRSEHGQGDGECAPDAQRWGARVLEEKQPGQANRHGDAGVEHGTPRGRGGHGQSRADVVTVGLLLAVAVDHEEGIIDGDAQSKERDDVASEVVDVRTVEGGQPDGDTKGTDDGEHTDAQRQRCCDEGAEHDEQHSGHQGA